MNSDVPREDFKRQLDEIEREIQRNREGKRRKPEKRDRPNTAALMGALKKLHGPEE